VEWWLLHLIITRGCVQSVNGDLDARVILEIFGRRHILLPHSPASAWRNLDILLRLSELPIYLCLSLSCSWILQKYIPLRVRSKYYFSLIHRNPWLLLCFSFNLVKVKMKWSQWPCGLRRGSAAARLLGLWVRIPPRAWMSVSCECCVLLGRGLCDGLVTRSEEFYRVWCVSSVIVKPRTMRRPRPPSGCRATEKKVMWRHIGGREVELHTFLPYALDGSKWSTSRPGRLTPWEGLRYPLNRRLCCRTAGLNVLEKKFYFRHI
jgi:hypothetical protein